jgi:hypothetical protein
MDISWAIHLQNQHIMKRTLRIEESMRERWHVRNVNVIWMEHVEHANGVPTCPLLVEIHFKQGNK